MTLIKKARAEKLASGENPNANLGDPNNFRRTLSPQPALKSGALMPLKQDVLSPQKLNIQKMVRDNPNGDLYMTPRFAKPRPFFEQAYVAKSQLDAISQASTRMRKFEKRFIEKKLNEQKKKIIAGHEKLHELAKHQHTQSQTAMKRLKQVEGLRETHKHQTSMNDLGQKELPNIYQKLRFNEQKFEKFSDKSSRIST